MGVTDKIGNRWKGQKAGNLNITAISLLASNRADLISVIFAYEPYVRMNNNITNSIAKQRSLHIQQINMDAIMSPIRRGSSQQICLIVQNASHDLAEIFGRIKYNNSNKTFFPEVSSM